MSLRAPDLPDTEGPFLFPAARTRTRQPDTLDLEGPFELGEAEVSPARSAPEYVRWVQDALNRTLGTKLSVDGRGGPATRTAIASFQRSHKLNPDGVVGPSTEAMLASASGVPAPAIAGGTASAAGSRARYANWSDADDRRKGRNPREQNIPRDGKVVAAAGPQGESKVLDFPMPGDVSQRLFLLHNFKVDGAALRPEHKQYLEELAQWIRSRPERGWQVFAEAHASRTGSARHDDVLSEDRYLVTRAFLESQLLRAGVDAARLRMYGEGVGFRHSPLPGEDPRARSVYVLVQPNPSRSPPIAWPPPIVPVVWPPARPPPRPHPVPQPLVGETLATRPQVFAGLDKDIMPEGPRAPGPLWLGHLLRESTFRVTGAYLQFAPARHWLANVLALRDEGWGVGGIFLGDSRDSYVRKVNTSVIGRDGVRRNVQQRFFEEPEKARWRATMTAARGTAHAVEAKALAVTAALMPGSVIWFDNEDPSDVVFETHEFQYYAAFLTELVTPRRDAPAFRPGLYAHQKIAAQLLARHPELWIWEVDYDNNNINRETAPPMRATTPADRRFGLDPTNTDAVIKAFRVLPAPGVAGSPWGCWPVWRQWQGNNNINLPSSARGALTPVKKWDWNSSLVRDPSDPRPTPRLSVAAGGPAAWVAKVEDLDPTFAASGRRTEPRRGRLTMRLPVPGARPVDVAVAPGLQIHPGSAIVPVVGAGAVEMIVVFSINELGSTVFDARQWQPVRPLWNISLVASPRLPHSFAAAAPSPLDLHVVWAATGQQLWTARRAVDRRWGDPVRMAGDLLLHPFARVAAAPCGESLHVLTVDQAGRLVHANWAPPTPWPSRAAAPLGGDPILPAADIALLAGDTTTLVAVAVGTDLRLRRWTLRVGDARARWSASAALGGPQDTVHAQTAIGVHRPRPGTVVVTAVGGEGNLRRFTLEGASGWAAPAAVRLEVAPGVGAVHPLSDLPSLPDGRLLIATVRPGEVSAAFVDPATGAAAVLL